MMRRLFGALALVLALGTIGSERVQACSCIGPLVSCETVFSATAVFVGKVATIEAPGRRTPAEPFPQRRVVLEVVETFKGVEPTAQTLDVFTGNGGGDCGYPFIVGSSYLVFADEWKGRLTVTICSNTAPIENAATDLAYLRGPFRDSPSAGVIRGVATRFDPSVDGQGRTNEPFEGARIRLEGYSHTTQTTTGKDGSYEFRVPPGDYRLFAEAWPGLYTVPGWDDGQAFTLRDARACVVRNIAVRSDGRVTGRLVDRAGRGVPLTTVELARGTERENLRRSTYARARTDEKGYFEFVQLEPGRYLLGLTLERDPGRPDEDDAIWVNPLRSDDLVKVELEPEMRWDVDKVRLPESTSTVPVSGVVVDANGDVVPGAQVWVAIEPRLTFGSMPFVTGDSGAFRFNVVAGRKYRLHAEQQVTVGERGQSRSARSEPFEASAQMKPFRLVLGSQ